MTGSTSANTLSTLFDGINEYAKRDNPSFSASTGMCLSMWVMAKSLPAGDGKVALFSFGDNSTNKPVGVWSFGIRKRSASYSGARFELTHSPVGVEGQTRGLYGHSLVLTGTTGTTAETWYHVVVGVNYTGSSATTYMFVNGVAQTINAWIGTDNGKWWGDMGFTSPTKAVMGAEYVHGAFSNYFNGWIDEVTLWQGILNQTKVNFLYNGGIPMANPYLDGSPSLVASWKMGDGSTHPTIKDMVGNTNPMTLVNSESSDFQAVTPP